LGNFGHQKHRLEANGHGLQFPEAPAFAADLLALAVRTDKPFGLAQQKETDAALAIFRPPILVSFANAKRMSQSLLYHAFGVLNLFRPAMTIRSGIKVAI